MIRMNHRNKNHCDWHIVKLTVIERKFALVQKGHVFPQDPFLQFLYLCIYISVLDFIIKYHHFNWTK